MNNGGGCYSERERETERHRERKSRSGGWKIIEKDNTNKRLAIGVGYSGRAALRREQCDVHAVARFQGNRGGCLSND
jgi:hypothetical protein